MSSYADNDCLSERFYLSAAAAWLRGQPEAPRTLADDVLVAWGLETRRRLHYFKRSGVLPRVRRVLGFLRSVAPTSLVDIGTGRGAFLWPFLDAFPGTPTTCVDRLPRRCALIADCGRGGLEGLSVLRGDAQDLPVATDSVDVVTALEVLEHMPEPERAAVSLVRAARRWVVLSVPSRPDDNPEHLHLFTPSDLERIFTAAGAPRVQTEYLLGHILAFVSVDTRS